jgi:preprotein translocase subunit YajC
MQRSSHILLALTPWPRVPLWPGGEPFKMMRLPQFRIDPTQGDISVNAHWLSLFMLFAQAGNGGGGQGGAGGGQGQGPAGLETLLTSPLMLLLLLGIVFYFIVMRPQRKEQAKRRDMLANVKKNDRVVTIGGIYGVVMNVHREADEITLKVDESTNTKLRMTISSIARVVSGETAEEENKN